MKIIKIIIVARTLLSTNISRAHLLIVVLYTFVQILVEQRNTALIKINQNRGEGGYMDPQLEFGTLHYTDVSTYTYF